MVKGCWTICYEGLDFRALSERIADGTAVPTTPDAWAHRILGTLALVLVL